MTLLLTPEPSLIDEEPTDSDDGATLWAWMAVDARGAASLIAGHVAGVGMVTLVTTSEAHARGELQKAATLATASGRTVELRRYDLADVVERL